MTNENMRLHLVHRHGMDIGPENFTFDVAQPYRAMHRRMHLTGVHSHRHSPEPPEAAIEFALRCLQENRLRGWRQIAGTRGVVCACDDGSFGIRLGDKTEVRYYNVIAQVATILLRGKWTRESAKRV
jgi:hypothetical protein